jgi:hypothetical protein
MVTNCNTASVKTFTNYANPDSTGVLKLNSVGLKIKKVSSKVKKSFQKSLEPERQLGFQFLTENLYKVTGDFQEPL